MTQAMTDMTETTRDERLLEDLGRVHFIGVGGAGMSGIAHLMAARGMTVTGSDQADGDRLAELRSLGVTVHVGHAGEHVDGADTVVVSSAVHEDNPELARARALGLRVIHRSQALAWLTRGHRVIAVAGAHGKSTSTGMLVTALRELGEDPSFVCGAVISQLGTNAGWGGSDVFVIEADESDGSFLRYDTAGVLVTNIDTEHLDHYGSAQAIGDAFVRFLTAAREFSVVDVDDPLTRTILPRLGGCRRLVTFGEDAGAGFRLTGFTPDGWHGLVTAEHDGQTVRVRSDLLGHHNALNALGVTAVLVRLGHPFARALEAAGHYRGTARRFERRAVVDGITVVDDYAHHPTEVAAVLAAARDLVGDGRVLAVFEPHLYSRARDHADEFAAVFDRLADFTVVTDICGAREVPIPGVDGAWLAGRFPRPERVTHAGDWDRAIAEIVSRARPGDLVLTLGVKLYPILPPLVAALRLAHPEAGRAADADA